MEYRYTFFFTYIYIYVYQATKQMENLRVYKVALR